MLSLFIAVLVLIRLIPPGLFTAQVMWEKSREENGNASLSGSLFKVYEELLPSNW